MLEQAGDLGLELEPLEGPGSSAAASGKTFRATLRASATLLGLVDDPHAAAADLAEDQKTLQRFQLEAQVAGLLQHPRIVPVYDVGTVGEVPYFAMRYVEGCSLAVLLAELRGLPGLRSEEVADLSPRSSPSLLASGLITGHFSPARRLLAAGASAATTAAAEPTARDDSSERPGKSPIASRTYIRSEARVCARSPRRSVMLMTRGLSIATSSRPICFWISKATSGWPILAWPTCKVKPA